VKEYSEYLFRYNSKIETNTWVQVATSEEEAKSIVGEALKRNGFTLVEYLGKR
jgi:hypothetical protein